MTDTAPAPAAEANPPYYPESAMAIVAHPDDIEFGCSGTLALWARHGARISLVLVTSGDVGIAREDFTRQQAAALREQEARAAADVLGAAEIIFLREPDGMVQATLGLRKKLVREIRRFRPEVVISGDPTVVWAGGNYINHPDHRAVALATVDAIFPAAGQPHLFEELGAEGLTAHKVRKVYVTNWREGDTWVAIDETVDVKVAALKCHASQMGSWDVEKNIKQWAADRAKDHGMQYAEIYRVVTLESDEDWAKYKGSNLNRDR
ncbi:MAG: PIG-L family deacetylase [Anaerolineales bacterium]|nr:PIG-L family deacetylase [Anaerolineales bacterium]